MTGLVTSVRTRVLGAGPEKWLTTTTYYDDRCRMIQTVSDNVEGFTSRVDVKYDFAGNVVQQRESHQVSASRTDVLESENTYDDRGRLLSSTTRLNGGSPATVVYTYDAVGRLVSRKLGNTTETLAYNPRGWLTSKESTPFKMKLRYESPVGGGVACWNGNISEWEWQQGANVALMYGFTYDGVNRLKETTQQQKSGTTWSTLAGSYLERGLTYDRNGNIKTLQRTAGGTLMDNLVYTCTGNQLTSLTENVSSTLAGDVYSRGGTASGTYAYDKNGNMTNDSRRALDFGYNVLNLLSEVKTVGGELKAKYDYLADGTKLRVRDKGDVNGFDYLGSLTYRKSGAGLQLESASFGDGVIRPGDSNGGQGEVNYFLTDHLGSVRVIVDGNGEVLERNDYYPFGARQARSDYPQLAANRFKYNGKEEQVTGGLGYLDYGMRMGDLALGRWFTMDPLSENYLSQSPYHFSGNNPVINVDANGMDYWSTSDPVQIAAFLKAFSSSGGDYFHSFEPTTWTHFTDLEFLSGLTYDDERKIFSYEYGDVINGEATRVVRRLPGYDMLLLDNTFVDIRTRHGKDYYHWWERASGAIEQDYTIDAMFIPVGKGIGVLSSWVGKAVGRSSSKVIDKAVSYAMTSEKIRHIFGKSAHNLDALVLKMGGEENTIRAVLNAASGKLPASGVFKDVQVEVSGYTVYIRGVVMDGIPKLGTMFIK